MIYGDTIALTGWLAACMEVYFGGRIALLQMCVKENIIFIIVEIILI